MEVSFLFPTIYVADTTFICPFLFYKSLVVSGVLKFFLMAKSSQRKYCALRMRLVRGEQMVHTAGYSKSADRWIVIYLLEANT